MNTRIVSLLETAGAGRAGSTQRADVKEREGPPYVSTAKIGLEMARLTIEAYKQAEHEPVVMKKAKALAHTLRNMTIYIGKHELIVGNTGETQSHLPVHPEVSFHWLHRAVNDGYRSLVSDAEREEINKMSAYWRGRSSQGIERDVLPKDLKDYWGYNGVQIHWHGAEGGLPNYEKLFRVGLKGIIKEAEERLESLSDKEMSAEAYVDGRVFLEAAIITLRGVIDFGKRFADKAREIAKGEVDVQRKKEIEKIAEVCDRVPGNPPRTFHEALQFFWFIESITHILEIYTNGCGARFDMIFAPFYNKDRKEGRITREEALELMEYLFIKLDSAQLMPPFNIGVAALANQWKTVTIGGVDKSGQDVTNEVSYLVLEAARELKLPQPSIAFRYHEKTPRGLVLSAIDTLRTGIGYPAFFSDRCLIPYLVGLGIPIEDARDYGIEACMRWIIPGKNMHHRAGNVLLNMVKCLSLALTQGWDKYYGGRQLGARTPDPLTFTSIDDVINAYLGQVRFFAEKSKRITNFMEVFYKRNLPRPFFSALVDGCIERAQECRQWSYWHKTLMGPQGEVTLANALFAMKNLIFEEKRVSMAELLDALKNNWEGKEELRQMFWTQTAKFGNDHDEVDRLTYEVYYKASRILEGGANIYGFPYIIDGSSGASYYLQSGTTAATPDGRKDGESFNDGTISPEIGTDKKGPTAVLKSVSKVDPGTTYNHLLNQKFLPQYLEGSNKELLADYLKTWFDLGIHHIQFNVVDAATLRDAQRSSEKYKNLVVRIAGYSAFFVDLAKGVQDNIIERTEQAL